MNIKKIGLTALAASLVSVSANAGELAVSGSAAMTISNATGSAQTNNDTDFTMDNNIYFTGSGELDNGLTVNVSYELDEGSNSGNGDTTVDTDVWDNHWVSIGSDAMGTLRLDGHGGSSAVSALDTTAAGDIWDNFDGSTAGVTGVAVEDQSPGNNGLKYTLPSLMDGLGLVTSYKPQAAGSRTGYSEMAVSATYTGVEGLSVSYGTGNIETGTGATSGDQQVLKGAYAIGPITVAYSSSDATYGDGTNDQETTSYSLSYTVSDELSLSYGQETIEDSATANTQDAEYSSISAAYTAGGMTLSAAIQEGDNVDHSTNASADLDYFELGASFAF